jgi:DNA polymerase alpha-associated DNA helicase A
VTIATRVLCVVWLTEDKSRGSKFLKSWIAFLEENADLRYPNLADVYVDEPNAG